MSVCVSAHACVCLSVYVSRCVCACVRACVRVSVHARACVCVNVCFVYVCVRVANYHRVPQRGTVAICMMMCACVGGGGAVEVGVMGGGVMKGGKDSRGMYQGLLHSIHHLPATQSQFQPPSYLALPGCRVNTAHTPDCTAVLLYC